MRGSLNDALLKAVNTTAGTGGDFLPTPLAKEFINLVRDMNFMRQLFTTTFMSSKTKDYPKILTGPSVFYEGTEIQQAIETGVTTGTLRLTAKKFIAQIKLSEEVIEDADQDMESITRDQFAAALAEHEERAFIAGNPLHTATAGSEAAATDADWYTKDSRLAFKGLLTLSGDIVGTLAAGNRAADRVDAGGADFTTALARQAMYNMGKYGRVFENLILILNPWSANQLLDDPKLVTLDKYGKGATVVTGEFGALYGKMKVINSNWVTDGYGILVHKGNPLIGDRRKVKIKSEEVIEYDMRRFVLSERLDFLVKHQDALCQIHDIASPSDWS